MLYEFLVYPHEVCYRPQITMQSAYQCGSWVESVIDSYSFDNLTLPDGVKNTKDNFDESCTFPEVANFVIGELDSLCHLIIDSLGYGHYYFCLHNQDNCKPHFHLIFEIPRGEDFNVLKIFEWLGVYKWVRDDFTKRNKTYQRLVKEFPSVQNKGTNHRVLIFQDFNRSSRLRYLCHLDNDDKHHYSLTDVCSDVNYCDDKDVLDPDGVTPFATFLGLKERYNLFDECSWFEWLACARLSDDTRKALSSIKTDIHRYYVSLYYRLSKKSCSYV